MPSHNRPRQTDQTTTPTEALPELLGSWLRRLRDQYGKTQHEVAAAIHFEQSTISRLETGWYRTNRQEATVRALLELYGIAENDHKKYLTWGYPDQRGPDHSPRLDTLMDLEPLCEILQYEQTLVPDLLQTPEYARAALSSGHLDYTDDDIDQMLDERLCAQHALDCTKPPHLWMLIENVVLCRPLGGSEIWRKQIDHLLEVREHPNVTLQIIADQECGPAYVRHPFTCLRFAEKELPDLVCLPDLAGTKYLNRPHDTERYRLFHAFLASKAASSNRTAQLLTAARL